MKNSSENPIIDLLCKNGAMSSSEIHIALANAVSYATLKRQLTALVVAGLIEQSGKAKASRYMIADNYKLQYSIDVDRYFEQEIDEREIVGMFNFELITKTLRGVKFFAPVERKKLEELQQKFLVNVSNLSALELRKEMDRLAIDLSWKSSQIEGNTYSLLETERLLVDRQTASGKTQQEAIVLLNHKDALDFILDNDDYLRHLSVAKIENIHSILVQNLDVRRNIRNRRVGITGTNYRPLDTDFQIREAMEAMCVLVNDAADVFDRAFLLLVLISYIQPFADGNKRTARIISNAQLIANHYCPISFRTVDAMDYKKAMLVFYEQNNISAFKRIFIDQFEFAVENYF